MQQERGKARDSSTQDRTIAAWNAVDHAASADVECVVDRKGDVVGPTGQRLAGQWALRLRVRSREAVDRRRLGGKRK
jgi:hypothetical protein